MQFARHHDRPSPTASSDPRAMMMPAVSGSSLSSTFSTSSASTAPTASVVGAASAAPHHQHHHHHHHRNSSRSPLDRLPSLPTPWSDSPYMQQAIGPVGPAAPAARFESEEFCAHPYFSTRPQTRAPIGHLPLHGSTLADTVPPMPSPPSPTRLHRRGPAPAGIPSPPAPAAWQPWEQPSPCDHYQQHHLAHHYHHHQSQPHQHQQHQYQQHPQQYQQDIDYSYRRPDHRQHRSRSYRLPVPLRHSSTHGFQEAAAAAAAAAVGSSDQSFSFDVGAMSPPPLPPAPRYWPPASRHGPTVPASYDDGFPYDQHVPLGRFEQPEYEPAMPPPMPHYPPYHPQQQQQQYPLQDIQQHLDQYRRDSTSSFAIRNRTSPTAAPGPAIPAAKAPLALVARPATAAAAGPAKGGRKRARKTSAELSAAEESDDEGELGLGARTALHNQRKYVTFTRETYAMMVRDVLLTTSRFTTPVDLQNMDYTSVAAVAAPLAGVTRKRWRQLRDRLQVREDMPVDRQLSWREGIAATIVPTEDWDAVIYEAHVSAATQGIGRDTHHSVKRTFRNLRELAYETRRSRCGISKELVAAFIERCSCTTCRAERLQVLGLPSAESPTASASGTPESFGARPNFADDAVAAAQRNNDSVRALLASPDA
ncbi:hypothetical protein BC828DRAFT_408620 [Blastocladiella britannica]|nr:hypothetical protein BC828DRAFT_408620 [Blastocladiella britannica]